MAEEQRSGGINQNILDFANELLEEVRGKSTKRGRKSNAEKEAEARGEVPIQYTLKDKLDVLDRVIKLEALRLKLDPEGEGSGFGEHD